MESGDSQQNQNTGLGSTGGNVQVDFSIGKSDKDQGKSKVKGLDEIAEERMKQTFNVGGGTKDVDDLKRKREDYAVQLRKNKRYVQLESV